MFIHANTLDDLLHEVFKRLLRSKAQIRPTKGSAAEISGVLLELKNPRARLSRTETKGTIFSCLGETLWYLAKTNELSFIQYYIARYQQYSDDGKTIFGGYGPRLFSMRGRIDQLNNVVGLMSRKKDTRQAVIQIFDAEDITKPRKDIPCTCSLQFLVRNDRLHLFVTMRSNDAFLGLPHDVFAFTFIQELVARSLGYELGSYKHAVGSLHLYDRDKDKARQFLKEGFQSSIYMPAMPAGDQASALSELLRAERKIRTSNAVLPEQPNLPSYWLDLVRLLEIFALTGKKSAITSVRRKMSSKVYDVYIDKRIGMSRPRRKGPSLASRGQKTSGRARKKAS